MRLLRRIYHYCNYRIFVRFAFSMLLRSQFLSELDRDGDASPYAKIATMSRKTVSNIEHVEQLTYVYGSSSTKILQLEIAIRF